MAKSSNRKSRLLLFLWYGLCECSRLYNLKILQYEKDNLYNSRHSLRSA